MGKGNNPETLNLNNMRIPYSDKDLMLNLRQHLKHLEEKHDIRARKATLTSMLSGGSGAGLFIGWGISKTLSLPELIPNALGQDLVATTAGVCIAAATIGWYHCT